MEIIRISTSSVISINEDSVACIGFFDGVHIGHQKLLKQTIHEAKIKHMKSACITFDTDPWVILKKDKHVTNLSTVEERLQRMSRLGINRCYLLHFDEAMAQVTKEAFIKLLQQLRVQHVLCGKEFRFGYKNDGDITYLKQTIETTICNTEEIDGEKISSSFIETALRHGDINFAYKSLGYRYQLHGHVIQGRQIGRMLGFPTANVALNANYIIPKIGVYGGYIKVADKIFKTMINIGHNPTLNQRTDLSIEAHILDFDADIYGSNVTLFFVDRIRDEKKFEHRNALVEQLQKDVEFVRRMQDETGII